MFINDENKTEIAIHFIEGTRYITTSQSESTQVRSTSLKSTFDSEIARQIKFRPVNTTVESINLLEVIFF